MPFLQRIRVRRFRTAAISAILTVVASLTLTKVALVFNSPGRTRLVLLALAVVALVTSLFILFRIYRAYSVSYEKALTGDDAAATALNTMVRAYVWGNGLFLIVAMAFLLIAEPH